MLGVIMLQISAQTVVSVKIPTETKAKFGYNLEVLLSKRPKSSQQLSSNSLLFRSRKKFSTTYAIVFFSPDLFKKISNFSKTVHTIFIKFCTVILHPKGPLRAQRHQNRMTGM